MSGPRRLVCAAFLSAALPTLAAAQVPSAPDIRNTTGAQRGGMATLHPGSSGTSQAQEVTRRHPTLTDSRHRYHDEDMSGFRNPGGVGRGAMWYPAGNRFQHDSFTQPARGATFEGSATGSPTYSEMIAAQSMGVAKYNSIQNHIDNYARPYFGYGLGYGMFGGFY